MSTEFGIETTRCDDSYAGLAAHGDLDRSAAAVLAHMFDQHLQAGRRFFQLSLADVGELCPASIDVLTRAHERLLAARGTLVLTGVAAPMEAALLAAVPDRPLFMVAPTAADQPPGLLTPQPGPHELGPQQLGPQQ